MRRVIVGLLAAVGLSIFIVEPAHAERLCDPAAEDCRAILLDLIRNERVGIDVAFWFMEDSRYSAELIRRAQAGVPVRVIVDVSANAEHPASAQIVAQLAAAGIPMRRRSVSSILHWKMMLFAGQGQVEFSGANYSPDALVPTDPYRNYVDEAIFFTEDAAIVHSFMQRYDDVWTDTTSYADYANMIGPPSRRYSTFAITPEMNFPPSVSYRNRAVAAYRTESAGIDAIMYRITDRAHTDAIIAAAQRGVRVRLITEQAEYRDASRLWDSWNVDRLWMAGIKVRQRGHAGLSHQKSVLLRGQGMAIFGSSNWTTASDQSQEEHNLFTSKTSIVQWFGDQFDRKWFNTGPAAETQAFRPLPPNEPIYSAPANQSIGVPVNPVLTFNAGPFAHLYDIYVGTTTNPPLVAVDVELGPTESAAVPRTFQLPELAPGTTYYWRVVAKTMALQPTSGTVFTFTTAGAPGPAPAPLPSPPPTPTPNPNPGPDPVPPPHPVLPAPSPVMSIDLPGPGATVRQPFAVGGWALDLAGSDNGIDVVHVYAYPATGAPPIFLGVAGVSGARPDVGGFFGPRFAGSGYGLIVRGLQPGSYMIAVFAHSSYGAGFPLTKVVNVRVEASTLLALDAPGPNAVLSQGFLVGGWAADFSAASGSGIDVVHVYAYPLDRAGAPVFLGQAPCNVRRLDVGAAFGAAYATSGFNLFAPALPPGRYQIVAYGRSLVTGTFAAAAVADIVLR